jgi:hypothetical protein
MIAREGYETHERVAVGDEPLPVAASSIIRTRAFTPPGYAPPSLTV